MNWVLAIVVLLLTISTGLLLIVCAIRTLFLDKDDLADDRIIPAFTCGLGALGGGVIVAVQWMTGDLP